MPKDSKKRNTYSNKVKRKTKERIVSQSQSERLSSSQNVDETIEPSDEESISCSRMNIPLSLQKTECLSNSELAMNNMDFGGSNSPESDRSIQLDTCNFSYFNRELIDLNISKLFDHLRCSDEVVSILPNRSWAIHCTELPVKRIVAGELIMHNIHGRGYEPFYLKQIIFDEKLNFEILLLNSRTVLKEKLPPIRSLIEFESVLDYVNSLKICSGGPDFSKYDKVTLECAYKDQLNKWRHNLCTLEVTEGDTCESCISLEEVLKRHAQRINSPLKSRNYMAITRRRKLGQLRGS